MESVKLHHVWTYTEVDRRFWREHLEDFLPHDIFDAHTHVNEPRFRQREMTEEMRRQFWVNEVAYPISAADAQRCYSLVFPGRNISCLTMGDPNLDFDIEASNTSLAQECIARDWRCLAVTRPQWDEEKLSSLLDTPGVVGVKPYYSLIEYDPTTRDRFLEASIFDFLPHHQLKLLNRRRAWVTLHVPRAGRLGHPDNIAEIRRIRETYPDIRLVIAHLGRCYTLAQAREALPHFARDEGLFFDNSAVLNPDVHRFAIETLGPRRILYGTDNPIFYMRGRRTWTERSYTNHTNYPFHFNVNREPADIEAEYTLFMYEALKAVKDACMDIGLDAQHVQDIFANNARRLLHRG